MVELRKIMVNSFKMSSARTSAFSAPHTHTAAGQYQPTPPLETPGHSWACLGQFLVGSLWGPFLLGPGVHKVLFVPSKSLCPQSCLSSDGSMVGLMATSSKRAYAIPRSAAPRVPVTGYFLPVPPKETLRHSSGSVSVGWACILCPSQG